MFFLIIKNTKQYFLIKKIPENIFYVDIKDNHQSSSNNLKINEKNIQQKILEKSNNLDKKRTYFTVNSLSERPFILIDVDPNILQKIQDFKIDKLIFSLMINEYGDVEKVMIEEANLSTELLPILEYAFLQTKFSPGRIHGTAVPSTIKIEVKLD